MQAVTGWKNVLYQSIKHRAEQTLSGHLPNSTKGHNLQYHNMNRAKNPQRETKWTVWVLKVFMLSWIASLRTVIKLQKSPHLRNGEKYLTMSHVSPCSSFVL